MLGLNLALTSHCKWSKVILFNVANPVISPVLGLLRPLHSHANVFSVFYARNSNDTESSDDVSESNQKTCIKMKGLTNEK